MYFNLQIAIESYAPAAKPIVHDRLDVRNCV